MAFQMFGQPQQAMTPEGISRQRQIAQALLQQGMDYSPVQSPWQGAARIAQALVGGYKNQQANEADAALQRKKELEAATEKAKAEAEKRNTPIFHEVDGNIYNWNPYMAEGGKPLLLSQAAQKVDQWKSAGNGMFYRTGADGMPEYAKAPGGAGGGGKETVQDKESAKIAKEYVMAGDSAADAIGVADQLEKIGKAPSLERAIGPLQGNSTLQTVTDNIPVFGGMLGNAGGNAQIKNLTAKLEAQMGRVLNKGLGPQSDADAQRVKDAVGKLPYARSRAEFNMLVANIRADLAKIKARGDVARKRYPQFDFTNTYEQASPEQAPELDGAVLAPANDYKTRYGLE